MDVKFQKEPEGNKLLKVRLSSEGGLIMSSIFWLLLVGMLVVNPTDALAYIDATSGGLLIQLLLGGLAGVGVIVKLYWRKLVGIFRKEKE